MPPYPDSCGICHGDPLRRRFIDRELSFNTPHTTIEKKARELGLNVKRETIRKHVRVCIPRGLEAQFPIATTTALTVEEADPAPPPPPKVKLELDHTADFAMLVRQEAIRRLEAGELRVNTQDGLTAQGLIDRRVEKQKDREIVVILGKLLAGEKSSAEKVLVIEGEYSESNDSTDSPVKVLNALTAG